MNLSVWFRSTIAILAGVLTACTMDVSLVSLGSSDALGPEAIAIDGTLTVSGLKVTDNSTPNLTLSSSSITPTQMKITNNANCSGGTWVAYASTVTGYALTASDGTKDVSAQFKDASGAITSCVSTTVLLDTSAPTSPSLTVVADYTDGSSVNFVKSSSPTFNLSAVDATLYEMQISNSATCASGSYEPFAAAKVWALTASDGLKDVSVKYQDRFSHESTCVNISVVLDSTASATPVIAQAEGAEGAGSNSFSPKVFVKNISANEVADATHSGFLDYQARIVRVSDSAEIQAWQSVGAGPLLQLTGLTLVDGTPYRMEVRSRDKAGNTSSSASVTWTSSLVPFYVKSLENATPSTEFTSDSFTLAGGTGAVTVAVTNGAKVCISPCANWAAAGASVSATVGDTLSLKAFSPASGTLTSTITAGAYTTTWKISTSLLCPSNYVLVPGENGTLQGEFCLAKFEMKIYGNSDGYQTYSAAYVAESRADGTPWRLLNVDQMISECQALGSGYDLINNTQWNTVARNISSLGSNWSSGTVGTGQVNQGNRSSTNQLEASTDDSEACVNLPGFTYPAAASSCSDSVWHNFRRTHQLSNGSVLWDFSGGSWEGVKDTYADSYTGTNDFLSAMIDGSFFKMLLGAQGKTCADPSNTTERCGFGYAYLSNARPASAIFRGGSASNGREAGIFAIDFDYSRTFSDGAHGFRCVAPLTN
ncbi:hypothetical protein B9G69_009570 [Bdellovibrio sp. SKB1291214]|uniref:hypothetical protein n=1 Tax=Bdellovibrio sp. SKB1291214 TaxID=1732569 RepID=UPI00223F8B34|nr:hypothetical protein [Bdellovibrio sp. SKB1291214]UYL07293.1 hypothetical protein B9G69_009570 [Bdellovibrio sp. SKB1291214]